MMPPPEVRAIVDSKRKFINSTLGLAKQHGIVVKGKETEYELVMCVMLRTILEATHNTLVALRADKSIVDSLRIEVETARVVEHELAGLVQQEEHS